MNTDRTSILHAICTDCKKRTIKRHLSVSFTSETSLSFPILLFVVIIRLFLRNPIPLTPLHHI